MKRCEICGEAFQPKNYAQVTCGAQECRKELARRRKRERKGPPKKAKCAVCGKEFTRTVGQVYCSEACRIVGKKAVNQKRRERINAERAKKMNNAWEPTAAKCCPKDCIYLGKAGNFIITCDYILIEREPRPFNWTSPKEKCTCYRRE